MSDPKPLLRAAEKGAWISLDGRHMPNFLNGFKDSSATVQHHLSLMNAFRESGLLEKVLLSHDGSGTPKRPMDILFNTFIPMLKAHGYADDEIKQVTVDNPARAFAIQVRKG